MCDTGTATWESKYHYQFWRPITGIREANVGTGPTGRGENGQSRIYLGIHWAFDKTEGIEPGAYLSGRLRNRLNIR